MFKHCIKNYHNEQVINSHQHEDAQIAYIHHGCGIVHTNDDGVIIVSGQLAWIPPNIFHELRVIRNSRISLIHCNPNLTPIFSDSISLLSVTPLLTQLMADFAQRSELMSDATASAYSGVFCDQISLQSVVSGGRYSTRIIDKRLLPIIEQLSTEPSIKTSLSTYSTRCGASERTLNRLFNITFGIPFRVWRRNVVMAKALQLYRQGSSITDIALDLGYNSLSAFSAAFSKYQCDRN